MKPQPGISPTEKPHNLTAGIIKRVVTVVIFMVLQAVILFVTAGRLNWSWAWVYLGICLAVLIVNGTIMLRTNLETVAERGQPGQTKDWDKLVGGLFGLFLYFVLPLVAGLDERFGWSGEPGIGWHIAGAVLLVAGLALAAWAMVANAFFSTAVRIQSERGHTVCKSGPYRFVRHPGYVGFILQSISTAILLGSWWALVPGGVAAALMILRTALEDRTLQAELPGYPDYVQEVRYRLVPGIW